MSADTLPVAFELVYSPDDDGFYVMVVNRQGETLHTTDLFDSEEHAKRSAFEWSEAHGGRSLVQIGETWR